VSTSSRIRKLPPLLVNKIAAGEVVERPASVVKELIENAVDAGVTAPLPGPLNISVAVERGGIELIRVSDNGCGMSAGDVRLAVEPHATSKIIEEDDLYRIATMGFRGEALASIGAVSKLRLVSRPHDSNEGYEVRVAGKELQHARSVGCPPGTTVEMRDLFFNVPARRKFLKTPATETGHINEQFTRAALAHPEIGFTLTNNGRVSHNLPPCNSRLERISRFYGPELAAELISVERHERGTRIDAHLAPPGQSRATGNWQYVFVNGRYVRDRFIQHAIKEAYRGLIEQGRHPVVFLFLTVDPESIDVNVHPTKIEVRWAQSNLIHSQVLSALRETLQKADLTPALRMNRPAHEVDPADQDRIRREFVENVRRAKPTVGGATDPTGAPPSGMGHGPMSGRGARGPENAGPTKGPGQPLDAGTLWRSFYERAADAPSALPQRDGSQRTEPAVPSGSAPGQAALDPATLSDHAIRPAIQLHNMYLVVESEDGLLIIDQHALHERILYERLRSQIVSGPLESQRLLLPETLQVSATDLALLETHHELLDQLGIEVSPFGTDTLAVQAFPVVLNNVNVPSFMRDLIDRLEQQGEAEHPESVIHGVLDMMACKAAIKAGDPLAPEEIEALIRQKDLVEKSSNCPHGRPTTLRLTKSDLQRQFKRT